MPHRVCNTAKGTHIAAQFQQFQRGFEHAVGICHLLGADETVATVVGGGADILVNHGVGASSTVVAVGHLLAYAVAQVVCSPALPLGYVIGSGTL